MITLNDALQLMGGILAIGGSIMIAYGGLPKWDEIRHHGTYAGAIPVRAAIGTQHGYQAVGLVATTLGGVLAIAGSAPAMPGIPFPWFLAFLASAFILFAAHFVGRACGGKVSRKWEGMS